MKIDYDKYPTARLFEMHGVDFSGTRGDELYGTCPFTGKEDKFYVNRTTWLWDSKTAGMSGNVTQFLDAIAEDYGEAFDTDQIAALAAHRQLPQSAFKPWNIGWTGTQYAVPIRNLDGNVVDIRLYGLKKKAMRSTAGCHVGLMGAEHLGDRLDEPVYICEGEWDAMALAWLLRKTKSEGLTVAVPGAGIFKRDWLKWFSGRRVTALYDHDEPGRKGEQSLHQKLGPVAKSLSFVHWPDELPTGFDTRDWLIYGLKKGTGNLSKCLERLLSLVKKSPRRSGSNVRTESGRVIKLVAKAPVTRERPSHIPKLEDVHAVYRKWLHLPNTDAIDVMLATALSQEIQGPPVWLFLVSPPGGAKTITLAGLTEYVKSYATSSLTAHSLISGSNVAGAADPSLIPRLHGKVLVIKDFTSILGLRENEMEEIFSILRDAYDGQCGKVFGNGVERMYKSHFTIIAAVTPRIYEIGSRHAALGERFLKYVMGDNLHHHQEEDIISRAIENVDQDTKMREELAEVTSNFLEYRFEDMDAPKLDNVLHKRIISLAQLGARLRGTVSRDQYNSDMMMGRPFAEVGSRLGIQLSKLARALAVVHGRKAVNLDDYRIVRKVMLDTVSQRAEDIIGAMWSQGPLTEVSVADVSRITRYPMTTVRRLMDDLNLLKVIQRKGNVGSGFKHTWVLTKYIRRAVEESGVFGASRAAAKLVIRRGTTATRPGNRAKPGQTGPNPVRNPL